MILYLVSYFNVFLENFEFLSKTMFYPDSLFKEFLSSFTVFILLQLIFIFYGILYLFNNLICCHLCVNMSKEIHTKKSMAACSECRFICSSQYSLRRHQKIHAQGFSQHTSYKRKSKSYLFQNILMLFMFFVIFWSWTHIQKCHSKNILDNKSNISHSLPLLMFRSRSNSPTYPYHHTRKTILVLLLLCGDTDSMKNPGPTTIPSNHMSTCSSINGDRLNSNTRDCQFCLTTIKNSNKYYTCSNSHIFHPRCFKKWLRIIGVIFVHLTSCLLQILIFIMNMLARRQ